MKSGLGLKSGATKSGLGAPKTSLRKNERIGSIVHLMGPEYLYRSPGITKSR